jgi:hypothetical protein
MPASFPAILPVLPGESLQGSLLKVRACSWHSTLPLRAIHLWFFDAAASGDLVYGAFYYNLSKGFCWAFLPIIEGASVRRPTQRAARDRAQGAALHLQIIP